MQVSARRLFSSYPMLLCLSSPQIFTVHLGRNYHMNGVFSSGPQVNAAKNLVSRLPSLSKESNANSIVYELLPKGKTLTILNNATAHTRVPQRGLMAIAIMAPLSE